jgi:hypothetical protein
MQNLSKNSSTSLPLAPNIIFKNNLLFSEKIVLALGTKPAFNVLQKLFSLKEYFH